MRPEDQFNGKTYVSKKWLARPAWKKDGSRDLEVCHHPPGRRNIEVVMTHGQQYGEEYYSFVNGQNTTAGGTHLQAYWEAIKKTLRLLQ